MPTDKEFWEALSWMERERAVANAREVYPCPFCKTLHSADGDEGPQVVGTHPGTDWVECETCGASGPCQKQYKKKKGAAERARLAWNAWVHSSVEAAMAVLKGAAMKAERTRKKEGGR